MTDVKAGLATKGSAGSGVYKRQCFWDLRCSQCPVIHRWWKANVNHICKGRMRCRYWNNVCWK